MNKYLHLLKKCLLRWYFFPSQSLTIKSISLRNELCMVRPIFSNLSSDENS